MVVLIPAYQPDEQLVMLAKRFISETDFHIIVVNDGSASDKKAVFDALPDSVTVLTHPQNCGKGRAMKTGMAYIQEHYPVDEGVVVVDADGQHLLPDVLRVCDALNEHPEALILGSRQFTGCVPFRSKFGNTVTRYVFALASGVMIHDTQTGLRAFKVAQIPELLALKGERYEYEMYMLLGFAEKRIPIHEVYIETVYLDEENSSSHFHPLRDSFRIYASILKFTASSLIAFFIDYILFLIATWILGQKVLEHLPIMIYAPIIANVFARVISASCNFLINRHIIFKSNESVLKTAIKYALLVLFILALNSLLLTILTSYLHIPNAVAKLMVEVILFGFSFAMQRFFVFCGKKNA